MIAGRDASQFETDVMLVELPPSPAILIKCLDEEWQTYQQTYPFLSGPRNDLNESIFDDLPNLVSIRHPKKTCKIERLSASELALRPELEVRVRLLCRDIAIPDKVISDALIHVAWKLRDISPKTRDILTLGCGSGLELILLRAVAPEAYILGLDWRDHLYPGLKERVNAEFLQVNMLDYLAGSSRRFEVVFSNHVLEHLYDPDRALRLIRQQLASGGMMLAGLPLDGQQFPLDTLRSLCSELRRTDLGEFDPGHPWKTTASDLYETVIAAGFGGVRLVQREEHLNFRTRGDERELRAVRARGRQANRVIFEPIRSGLNSVFGRHPPRPLLRLLYGLERRIWFGSNNLKNHTTPEILVVATQRETETVG